MIAGTGSVRDEGGTTPIETGDAFVFKPGEPHQIVNDGAEDLVLYTIADNPIGESWHYPDSDKYAVLVPKRRIMRSDEVPYYEGEE